MGVCHDDLLREGKLGSAVVPPAQLDPSRRSSPHLLTSDASRASDGSCFLGGIVEGHLT